jgi:anti-sigma factor RsiW
MNCADVQAKIHPYIDFELDIASRSGIEAHLQGCTACAQAYAEQEALHFYLKQHAPDFDEPKYLRSQILLLLPFAEKKPSLRRTGDRSWWSFAAAIGLVIMLAWGWLAHQRAADAVEEFKDDAIAAHRRSLLADHLVDVHSSEPAELDAWFNSRLPFRTSVKDLSRPGYSLIGGRLEYLYTQVMAAAVYQRGSHVINVLMWPVSEADKLPSAAMSDGRLRVLLVTKDGTNFCVVSDLDPAELAKLTDALLGA